MGRKSVRKERRADIIKAFGLVLSQHGYAGATIVAVAETAGMSPGLLHHHFKNKREMLIGLFDSLTREFQSNLQKRLLDSTSALESYINTALKLDERANTVAAKCWVGILAEGLKDKGLMDKIKRHLNAEMKQIENLSSGKCTSQQSSSLLAYILGCLVFGAFAPTRTRGFAADMGKQFLQSYQL